MTFLIATLTGLGVGSGGLYILYLTLIKDTPQATAQGMNLIFFITATLAAATVNLIKKRISFPSVAFIIPSGIVGAIIGSRTASMVNSKVLSVMFGIMIATLGITGFIKMLKNREK